MQQQQQQLPPKLGTMTTEEYRQRLAGLADPEKRPAVQSREQIREQAIGFASLLPRVFGSELERTTLWDRIGSGLQTAYAKTQTDYELFINQVLSHIKAEPSRVANCQELWEVMETIDGWDQSSRESWMLLFHSHQIVILVHAKQRWTDYLEFVAEKKRNAEAS